MRARVYSERDFCVTQMITTRVTNTRFYLQVYVFCTAACETDAFNLNEARAWPLLCMLYLPAELMYSEADRAFPQTIPNRAVETQPPRPLFLVSRRN